MCGLGGFVGIKDSTIRFKLAGALGVGLDRRGGHAAGYVSLPYSDSGRGIGMARRAGKWSESSHRFIRAASVGESAIMHARYATCGEKDNPLHAHPFAIRRGEKSVLYGAHNGIVWGGRDTAKEAGREYTVDSKELFELLADGNYQAIQNLSGYGVINWVTSESGIVHMARLSINSDFACVSLACGGIAWASTMAILEEAVKLSGTEATGKLEAPEVGTVYTLGPDGIGQTGQKDLRVSAGEKTKPWHSGGMSVYGGYGGSMSDYFNLAPSTPRIKRQAQEGPMFRVGDSFKDSNGVYWTRLHSGWIKDRDMKPESSKSNAHVRVATTLATSRGISTVARPGYCIHGARLNDQCDSCTGPKSGAQLKLTSGDKAPDTERSPYFPPVHVVGGDNGDLRWYPVEVNPGRVVWIPDDLDAMTDSQLGQLTEAQWEAIMAQYTPEAEEEAESYSFGREETPK